jgi:hypothetical protein
LRRKGELRAINSNPSKDRLGFLFGRKSSPMYTAARFAQAFKPIVGDSGTATRSALPSPTDFVLSLPFNLATKAYASNPTIEMATRAQAAGRSLRNPLAIPQSGQLPTAGLLSGAASGLAPEDEEQMRLMREALMNGPRR